jgi:glucosamine 6-phosphate synthetase-like amidotransferase/phosphosugar isomerase protein
MCQLAAYIGDRPIATLLLGALEHQEPYYGAHATGLGVIHDNKIELIKSPGFVDHVKAITQIEKLKGTTGIAHSRYNSDAKIDERYNTSNMAHPFLNNSNSIALMHNGNISNFKEHWKNLRKNHIFTSYSEEVDTITDSEIAVHMLNDEIFKGKNIEEAFRSIAPQLAGSFLLLAISKDEPETIYIANWYQPCFVGVGDNEVMFCSSKRGFNAVKEDINRLFEPPKNSIITLNRDGLKISPLDKRRKVPEMNLDKNKLADLIIETLQEKKYSDFRELFYALNPNGWAEAYGITPLKWETHRKNGVSIVNPYIEVVDMLIKEGKIVERIDRRLEGGVERTPRFFYVLA